jgi:hypothetical protein
MTDKYIPGPWEFGYNARADIHSSGCIVVRPAGDFPHGGWIADCGRAFDDTAMANARLIAAAPCLLDIVRMCVAQMKNDLVIIDSHAGDCAGIDELMGFDHLAQVALIKQAERLIKRATKESNQRY